MKPGFLIQNRPQSAILVLILGIVISVAVFQAMRQAEDRQARSEFERRAEVQHEAFRESINRYQELLRVTRSFMAHSPEVNRRDFQEFSSEVMSRYAGIQALEWVPRVPGAGRAQYEQAARANGLTNFQFFDFAAAGNKVRAADRVEHFPLFYAEPAAANGPALGFDLAGGPTQRELAVARDINRTVATQKLKLVEETGSQFGWIMILPVYQGNLPSAAGVEERRKQLRGYVEGVFRVEDLMVAVWQKAPFASLDTLVLDSSAPATNRFFYFHSAPLRKQKIDMPDENVIRAGMHQEIHSQVAGRDFIFLFRPAPEWLAGQHTQYPSVILVTGLLFSVLVAGYFRTVSRRTELVEQQVAERTASLKIANEQLEKEIAERKRAEEERAKIQREREEIFERLQMTLNRMPVGCILNDAEFKFTYWNPAAERIFGYKFEEVRGRHPYGLITPPSAQPMVEQFFERLKHGDMAANGNSENTTRDGRTILCEWHNTPLRKPDGTFVGILSMCQDITEGRRVEAERLEMERNLQETQKLESLGVLAGGIAHDFNNLLTGVLGNASLARLELAPAAGAHDYLRQIEIAALRAADLCKQMLAYSGKGRFVIEPVNLTAVVEESAHLLELSISKKATLKLNLSKNLPLIQADVSQMRQVIMNLVSNASEAIGDQSGLITVSTGVMRVDRAYLADTFLAPELPEGNYVYLEVNDNGCGMSAETKARIFEPFYTTKFTGRGLGLAAVLGIVRGHKGTLKVYTEEGRGSTFKLLLPCVHATLEGEGIESGAKPVFRGTGTVLVVDDEETVRNVVPRMLESMGFETVVARDGREGLQIFRREPERFALVLLDLTMPEMDGEETFRELHRVRADLPVLLMSGFNEREALDRFVGKGLGGFIQKPFGPEALQEKVASVLNQAAS